MTTPFNQPAALRVLITGAAGNIGRVLCAQLKGRYALLRETFIDTEVAQFHGGMYCPMEFVGDTLRIDGGPL